MSCDIVICVYNQLDYTKACIESIKKYTHYPYRIIIVDDASSSPTREYLDDLARKREITLLRNEKNLGWLKSANKGMMATEADYICLMNNDTLVTEGWLEEMISIAEKEEDIGLVNPSWEKPPRVSLDNYVKTTKRFSGQYIEIDFARGFCMLIKNKVIKKIGYFDEVYSPGYFDDHDFSVRAIKAGFRCVRAKGSFVLHYRNVTFQKKLNNEAFGEIFERNRRIFYHKWGRPLKIVFVLFSLTEEICGKLDEVFINLARDQNRIYLLCKDKFTFSTHTNIYKIKIPNWLFRLGVLFFIWDNSHRNPQKHYDLIFVSSLGFKDFILKFNFAKKYKILYFDFFNTKIQDSLFKIVDEFKSFSE